MVWVVTVPAFTGGKPGYANVLRNWLMLCLSEVIPASFIKSLSKGFRV
jgi:hypothetical protein